MIGLGARDSLRLEAGLCLYGHDIDNKTTPIEGNLQWSIGKCRREGGDRAGNYLGSDIIQSQMKSKPARKRMGILPLGKAPVREGAELVDANQKTVGRITSGGFSPSLNKPIAMGYIDVELATLDDATNSGTKVFAMVRGKALPVSIVGLPFVPNNYFRG